MAEFSYEGNAIFHRVFHPETLPETHQPPPRFVQIELTISVDLFFIRHDSITGQFTDSDTDPFSSQETLHLDLDLLKNRKYFHQLLAPTFTRLKINTASTFYDTTIDEIIEHGLRITSRTCKNRVLRSEIWGSILEYESINHEERALAETASEFNYGMVPAKESSIRKMLKRVRVESGGVEEDCMICLEKITVESYVSRMPCSHTYHVNCIKRWLKQSHYCPICRFEMPT